MNNLRTQIVYSETSVSTTGEFQVPLAAQKEPEHSTTDRSCFEFPKEALNGNKRRLCYQNLFSEESPPFSWMKARSLTGGMIHYVEIFFITTVLMLLLPALALSLTQKVIRSLLQKLQVCHTNETWRDAPTFIINKKMLTLWKHSFT